jgi:hypothetical protein
MNFFFFFFFLKKKSIIYLYIKITSSKVVFVSSTVSCSIETKNSIKKKKFINNYHFKNPPTNIAACIVTRS